MKKYFILFVLFNAMAFGSQQEPVQQPPAQPAPIEQPKAPAKKPAPKPSEDEWFGAIMGGAR